MNSFPRQGLDSVHLVFGLTCALMHSVGAPSAADQSASRRSPISLEERRVQVFCLVPDIARLLLGQAQAELPISVGQQMDVYIEAGEALPTGSPEPAEPETFGLAARGEPR